MTPPDVMPDPRPEPLPLEDGPGAVDPALVQPPIVEVEEAEAEDPETEVVAEEAESSPFDAVSEPLRSAMIEKGFDGLTEVQQAVLDSESNGRDLRISSQTGSGKTVALGLAIAEDLILESDADAAREHGIGPKVLVIAPTRELAAQVHEELGWLFAGVRGVRTECVTGGTHVGQERRRLTRNPRIVVGTPGRLLDHVQSGALDCSGVGHLILDEADQMLDMGFRDELEGVIEAIPGERRTHLVSATFPREVQRLCERYQSEPLRVEGTQLGAANVDIEHIGYMCKPSDRYSALVNLLLLAEGSRSLVFVRTRADASLVAERLVGDGFAVAALSGDLQQAQRTRTLAAFRAGTVTTLVATDVAARGLDVPEVASVIHGDLPMDGAIYTHRSGRTGRAGRKGRSLTLVPPAARRRVERMMRDARVEIRWGDLPTKKGVAAALERRENERLAADVSVEREWSEAQLVQAETLLAGRDPVAVVAALVARSRAAAPTEPREVEAMEPFGRQNNARREGYRDARPERGPSRDPGRGPRNGDYLRFEINWGSHGGANPKRVLAHICRRGGISSREIGAIQIGTREARFEIERSVADRFATKVRVPDSRDPHLVIRRVRRSAS